MTATPPARLRRLGVPLPAAGFGSRSRLVLVVLGLAAVVEFLTRGGVVDPLLAPPPSAAVAALVELIPTATFRADLLITSLTIGVSFGLGLVIGVVVGVVGWRLPLLGRVGEPYLVTLYAVPTIVFYPIFLAIMGLGPGPIIVVATIMAVIPPALNTMVALRSVDPVLVKTGASLNCSRWQLYRKVLLPAATPLAIPGVRLGFIYAMLGAIAGEFVLASAGLGYRVAITYRQFETEALYGLIIFIAVLAILGTSALDAVERRIRKDML